MDSLFPPVGLVEAPAEECWSFLVLHNSNTNEGRELLIEGRED